MEDADHLEFVSNGAIEDKMRRDGHFPQIAQSCLMEIGVQERPVGKKSDDRNHSFEYPVRRAPIFGRDKTVYAFDVLLRQGEMMTSRANSRPQFGEYDIARDTFPRVELAQSDHEVVA